MDTTEEKHCVFTYFANNEFKGFRQDTFGTLGKNWAKVYGYSPEQVEIIKKNTEDELNNTGTSFMKALFGMNTVPVNIEGQELDKNSIIDQVSKGEQEKRNWGNFELRVLEWCSREEFYEACTPGEEWKKQQIIDKYMKESPLEVFKFKTVLNEN